jgi:diguanylate cyclase (GGDEF)-like protein
MSNSEISCPIPINEEQRLRAVRALERPTTADPALHALVALAAQVCETPTAWISLVDAEHVDLVAAFGPAPGWSARATAPDAHAIVQPDQLLVVDDLPHDTRFATLTATPCGLALAYAGVAIVDAHGLALGALSVACPQVRSFRPAQLEALRHLACAAVSVLHEHHARMKLAHQAITDELTALSNRRHFRQAQEGEMAHAMRTGEPFTVLTMDLDGFRAVKEGFGQLAGEEVLTEVARRLREVVRVGDVLARFDGDEFGVIMRHGAKESAQVLAKRIVKAVSAPITLQSGDTIGVGISVGMAAYADDIESVATLLTQAELALGQAKRQNERRWKMFVGIR